MKPGTILMPATPQVLSESSARPPRTPAIVMPWLLLPAVTGVLLWLCFYPLGWGFLGWVALVPFLLLVRLDCRPWKIYVGAFLGGCLFFWSVLSWMTVADYRMVYLWGMLATYCALYFPVSMFIIRRLDGATAWPLTLTVPLAWTGLEFVRSFFGTGFAWYFLGHSQHHYLPVIQVADLMGVYGITFVMAAFNGWLAERLLGMSQLAGALPQREVAMKTARRLAPVLLTVLAAQLAYGGWRLSQEDFRPGPRVTLLQGNIDQRFREEAAGTGEKAIHSREEIEKYYVNLCKQALRVVPGPDLLVWPETSYPFPWLVPPDDLNKADDNFRDAARFFQAKVRGLARGSRTNHLFGINTTVVDDLGKRHSFNSGLLITRAGDAAGRYDKVHRVPFGEYLPFRGWLPFLSRFVPYDADYGVESGTKLTRFELNSFHFGVLVCYEDTDPFLARQYACAQADGPAVDFLLNISNDGWFDGSSQHAEHLAISRFRAVESRRALARAVNMGISAVIDSNGRVQRPKLEEESGKVKLWGVVEEREKIPDLPESSWRDFTKVQGVLSATIPIDNRLSLYAWTGDWLPMGCWVVICAVWVWQRVSAKRPQRVTA